MEDIVNACNDILNGSIESYKTRPLDSTERANVHEYCKNIALISTTVKIHGLTEKFIIIEKPNQSNQPIQSNQNKITHEAIDWFSRYSMIPIPTTNPDHINYYLTELKNYYDCKQWDPFVTELNNSGLSALKSEANKIKFGIIQLIKNNEEYINFCKADTTQSKSKTITKKSVYNHTNAGKYFLSIDIKSANFTNLKKYCPSIQGKWEDLVKIFSDSIFLAKSKHLREIIFGELGNKKLFSTINIMITDADDLLKLSDFYNQLDMVTQSTDEIIYEISEDFDISQVKNILNQIDPTEQIYRIEKFKLVQLEPYQYFVKELSDGQIQFKSIPKYFIMQCVKHYINSDLTDLDKKFMYEDFEAMFSDLLTFI